MMSNHFDAKEKSGLISTLLSGNGGFSLIELLVGMAVTGIVGISILGSYITISKHTKVQRDLAVMQMNLSNSVEEIEQQFRMVGYDPEEVGLFGVLDVKRYSVTDEVTAPAPQLGGSPAVTLVYDDFSAGQGDGVLDENDTVFGFRLFDDGDDGIFELARDTWDGTGAGFTRQILAENILAVGFAYAVDVDRDGELDQAAGGNIVWAIDSDNDGDLDFNIDANGDGQLNEDDDDGDNVINSNDVTADGDWTTGPANMNDIRVVKIWILSHADGNSSGYHNDNVYRVGDRILSADNGDFSRSLKCQMIVRAIECRNL